MSTAVANDRVEHTRGQLLRKDLRDGAMDQFALWFEQACQSATVQPDAMSLATVSASGQPSLRTVLLKSFDERGFVFFTNLESRKAREIAENSRVALLFAWLSLERQVVVAGTAEQVSTAEALRYFISRPRGSQIAAWSSKQSSVITSRKVLELEWLEVSRKFARGEMPLPSFWGGYRVRPREVEFWQGRPKRLHDRFLYSAGPAGHWRIERLAP
jgi:pyridoxamine 5'-phosphate oxidase